MHIDQWWLVPLGAGGAGAAALALLAARLDRSVQELKKSMRPLRTGRNRPPRES